MIHTATIPQELRALPQWCVWKYETRDGDKPTKVPYQTNGRRASSTDPETWNTFGAVLEADGFDGIGFIFNEPCGMCGVDLDNAIEGGVMKPWGMALIRRFNTYTEVSPSGLGVKMWIRGKYPGPDTGKRVKYRDGKVEMYHTRRFFTVTGNNFPGTPEMIREDQSAIDGIYKHILCPPVVIRTAMARPTEDAIDRCLKYIERCPDAISGESGHDRTFRVACECFRFGLSDNDAHRVLEWYNSTKCQPQWNDRELDHKLESARAKVDASGEFGVRVRQVGPIRIPIAKPPDESTGLDVLIEETISGKRTNIGWPWPCLTRMARALLPGTITILCGQGGSAKSLMVSEACLHWLESGIPFAVFHLEEDREFHEMRALAQLEENAPLTTDVWQMQHPDETRAARARRKGAIDALGRSIWDAPASDVSLDDLDAWVRERATEGRRIILIDPVTAADSGKEPWLADRRFVLGTKRILREHKASLILVTHPRDGNPKHGGRLDNHAGGQAYNRFTQCVLSLESCTPSHMNIRSRDIFGSQHESQQVNRMLHIRKSRSGAGGGESIGFWFKPESLTFDELGVIDE